MTLKPSKPFSTIRSTWSWKNVNLMIPVPYFKLVKYHLLVLRINSEILIKAHKASPVLSQDTHPLLFWVLIIQVSHHSLKWDLVLPRLCPYSCMLFPSPGQFSALLSLSSHLRISCPLWRLSWMPHPTIRKVQIPSDICSLSTLYFSIALTTI